MTYSEQVRLALAAVLKDVNLKDIPPLDRTDLVDLVAAAMFPKGETAELIREAMGPYIESNS